jgi:CheY-like chemotaxis protein
VAKTSLAKFANLTKPLQSFSIPGAAYETDKQEATDAGAQGYLVKPSDLEILLDEVDRLIAEARIAFPLALAATK